MKRRIIDISRRQLLLGGGLALGLPVLPSLLVETAYGADPVFKRPPRLFWLTTDHGGAFESSFFPPQSLLTESSAMFADHSLRHGKLQATTEGSQTVLSNVLRADSALLTPSRIEKMNVLYGLDVPFYIAHTTGVHLGNYGANAGHGPDSLAVQKDPRPTIDQLLAWSPTFYPDLSNIRERAMVTGGHTISWNYSDPAARAGTIDYVRPYQNSLELFERIFVPPAKVDEPKRPPVVDHVLESYKQLRNGNRRLSAADRQRLDDHIARIAELERKLQAGASASCGEIVAPTDDAWKHRETNTYEDVKRWAELFNEVIVAGFMCGTSRIAATGYGPTERFVAFGGDWHQEVAHMWQIAEGQALIVQSYQRFFESVMLDIVQRLDVEEAPGSSYLDNSLIVWSQESGMETHGSVSLPIVTFGGAAGFFKTGQFIDYRRVGNPDSEFDPGAGGKQTFGLLYSQWLGTVLQSMGLAPAEFERWGHKGYGVPLLSALGNNPNYAKHYESTSSRYFQMASDVLPGLKA